MTVGVLDERLPRPIGALFSCQPFGAAGIQLGFHRIQISHDESEMAPSMMGLDRLDPITDEVQFLITPQAKPGTGEIERGPLQRR